MEDRIENSSVGAPPPRLGNRGSAAASKTSLVKLTPFFVDRDVCPQV